MVQTTFWPEDDDTFRCPHLECESVCGCVNCTCEEEEWDWKDCDCEECTCQEEEEDEVGSN